MRRRLWRGMGMLVLIGLLGAGLGCHIWAWSQHRAAQTEADAEKYEAAREHVHQCLRVWWWRTADTYLLAARLERLTGDLRQASEFLARCEEALGQSTNQTRLEALLIQADTSFTDKVENSLWASVASHPDRAAPVLRTLAKNYGNRGYYQPALKALNQLIKLKPQSGEALEWRGTILLQQGLPEVAVLSFAKAVDIAPHRSQARFQLVLLMLDRGNGPAALPHITLLLHEEPERPEYFVALARVYFLKGEIDKARQLFDQVLTQCPSNFHALLHRAILEFQDRQFAAATHWIGLAIEQDPNHVAAHSLHCLALSKQATSEETQQAALKKYQQLKQDAERLAFLLRSELEKSKEDADTLSEIGAILLRTGQEQQGLLWLERALSLNPNHGKSHQLLANYFKDHEPARANQHLKLAKAN